jgi:hypothetical protein
MKREDDQPLWDLLGRAARSELSPFFARNVVRRIREERVTQVGWLRYWLSPRRLVPAAALATVVIAATVAVQHPGRRANPVDNVPEVLAQIDPQDYDVVADLDELIAADNNDLWDDDVQSL